MTATGKTGLLTVEDYDRLPTVPAQHRLSYGGDPVQFGDLYLPSSGGPHPVVVMVHGGCWQQRWGLEALGRLCRALADEGIAVWSIEYRRLGGGGGWPTTFTDVAAAADYVRTIAPQWNLDLTRVISAGHSAGGQLALWLAGRHRIPPTSELHTAQPLLLRGVVALAGIADLEDGIKRSICDGACHEVVGGLPTAVPRRYRDASPIALLPLGVPQWLIVGRDDDLVPAAHVEQYAQVAKQHDEVHLELLPNAGHFEVIVPDTAAWATVRHAVLTLLKPA